MQGLGFTPLSLTKEILNTIICSPEAGGTCCPAEGLGAAVGSQCPLHTLLKYRINRQISQLDDGTIVISLSIACYSGELPIG